MVIYEPCNYVSNLAYYHVSTSICDHGTNFHMDSESVRALGRHKNASHGLMKSRAKFLNQTCLIQVRLLPTLLWALLSGTAATR